MQSSVCLCVCANVPYQILFRRILFDRRRRRRRRRLLLIIILKDWQMRPVCCSVRSFCLSFFLSLLPIRMMAETNDSTLLQQQQQQQHQNSLLNLTTFSIRRRTSTRRITVSISFPSSSGSSSSALPFTHAVRMQLRCQVATAIPCRRFAKSQSFSVCCVSGQVFLVVGLGAWRERNRCVQSFAQCAKSHPPIE